MLRFSKLLPSVVIVCASADYIPSLSVYLSVKKFLPLVFAWNHGLLFLFVCAWYTVESELEVQCGESIWSFLFGYSKTLKVAQLPRGSLGPPPKLFWHVAFQ